MDDTTTPELIPYALAALEAIRGTLQTELDKPQLTRLNVAAAMLGIDNLAGELRELGGMPAKAAFDEADLTDDELEVELQFVDNATEIAILKQRAERLKLEAIQEEDYRRSLPD